MRIYGFSNENLTSYQELYDFSKRRVLSVEGSGDQYFTSILFDAKDVTLFDISNTANFIFVLKFFSIRELSYEEFIKFAVQSKFDDEYLYNKVRKELPKDTSCFFDNIIKSGRKLSSLIFLVSLNNNPINFSTGRVIPYFDRNAYYILQSKLRKLSLPKIYNLSLENLYKVLDESYDIMLFSNIYSHMNMNVSDYVKFLKHYRNILNENGIIQVHYSWTKCEFASKDGIICDRVPSVRYIDDEKELFDYVFTLRK